MRTPRNYDGTRITTKRLTDVLPDVLNKVCSVYQNRSDLILAAWPMIIGPKLAGMTRAVSFHEGILVVKVKNSTLYSLLSQNDKPRILGHLRKQFPSVEIKNILFRIG